MSDELDGVRGYRSWLEHHHPYWKKQLRNGDPFSRRTAGFEQVALPPVVAEFFAVLNGQKSDKQYALPCDGSTGLVLLDVKGCAGRLSNNLGRNLLIRNLPYEVAYSCDAEVRAGAWRKTWFPIAERNNGWGMTTLFVDFDAPSGFSDGHVVLETLWLGKSQGRCLRTSVAESVAHYFLALWDLARAGRLKYVSDRGVEFEAMDFEASKLVGADRGHSKVGCLED